MASKFRATFLNTSAPTSLEGIERYLASGLIRGIGPMYARRLIRACGATARMAGVAVAAGILTAVGGRTAHAVVVARGLGKVCLVGCRALSIDAGAASGAIAGNPIAEGDWISLDGETGQIALGRRAIVSELPTEELAAIAAWGETEQHGSGPCQVGR